MRLEEYPISRSFRAQHTHLLKNTVLHSTFSHESVRLPRLFAAFGQGTLENVKLEIIQNENLRLTVAPDLGASLTAFEVNLVSGWHPVMRPTSPATLKRGLEQRRSAAFSSYTLAPYSNRIRNNQFVFQGQTYHLRPNWPDGQTIHGDVRDRPVQCNLLDAVTLECLYDSRTAPEHNFPFDYTLKKTYRLEAKTLITHLQLTNTSGKPMPAGLGIHPYFVRRMPGSTSDPVLHMQARGVYDVDADIIPSAAARPITPDLDFSEAQNAYLSFIDRVYNGWDGFASLEWPGSKVRLTIRADPVFSHFVVFNGDPDGTLALEPVTHATDGFNLMARGVPGTDVRVLQPNQTLEGRIWINLETPSS